jgi:hypothetical protein
VRWRSVRRRSDGAEKAATIACDVLWKVGVEIGDGPGDLQLVFRAGCV